MQKRFYVSIFIVFCLSSMVTAKISYTKEYLLHSNSLITELLPQDSSIQNTIKQINPDSIKSYMLKLESFKTRYAYASNRDSVKNWIIDKFREFGYSNISIDSFYNNNTWCKNIIIEFPAVAQRSDLVVIGAHYDSYFNSPGADDNASGTAAVLEIARVLKTSEFKPFRKIKFIAFAAEESGLLGSYHIAKTYKESGQNIYLMINLDMIANSADSNKFVYIHSYKGFESYQYEAKNITDKFTNLISSLNYDPGRSDSYSFNNYGFPAIYFEEYESQLRFHSIFDSVSYCNPNYTAQVSQAAFAVLLRSSYIPSTIRNLNLTNIGDGSSIHLKWTKNNDFNFAAYKVYIGKKSWQFDSSFTTSDSEIVIKNLDVKSIYYLGVSALNTINLESVITQMSITTDQIPNEPVNLCDYPEIDKITLTWQRNTTDEDLLGYNIYRSIDTSKGFVKLNTLTIKDTTYKDQNVQDTLYYYFTTSVDITGKESGRSNIIKSHKVTMNRGILIVDDSFEYTGDKFSDAQVDSFYNSLVQDYNISSYDLVKENTIKLSDLVQYSTIIWHSGDKYNHPKYPDILEKYLDFGGNFLFTGYRVSAFMPYMNYQSSFDYIQNDFIYAYLKVRHIDAGGFSEFSSALADYMGYGSVPLDNSKNLFGYISGIESIQPTEEGTVIYRYNTKSNDSIYGKLRGSPVGIEYIGSRYKVIILSFPLFLMNYDSAKTLMNHIIAEKFDSKTNLNEKKFNNVKNYYLLQNYPNPFNSETKIKYGLPEYSHVEISIYDILGREITKIFSGYQTSGQYEVLFDGHKYASGIYIYKLKTDNFITSKKFLLLK